MELNLTGAQEDVATLAGQCKYFLLSDVSVTDIEIKAQRRLQVRNSGGITTAPKVKRYTNVSFGKRLLYDNCDGSDHLFSFSLYFYGLAKGSCQRKTMQSTRKCVAGEMDCN
jgi:hypothetical protein